MSSYPPFSAGDHFAWQQAQSRPTVGSQPAQGSFDPRPTLRRSALDRVPVGRRVSGIHRTKTLLGVREDWRESYEPLGQGWIIGTHTWYGYDEHGRGSWEERRLSVVIDASDALNTRFLWATHFNMVSVKTSEDGYVILEDGLYRPDWLRLRQEVHRLVDESEKRADPR